MNEEQSDIEIVLTPEDIKILLAGAMLEMEAGTGQTVYICVDRSSVLGGDKK
jgi:hypothetical protein